MIQKIYIFKKLEDFIYITKATERFRLRHVILIRVKREFSGFNVICELIICVLL